MRRVARGTTCTAAAGASLLVATFMVTANPAGAADDVHRIRLGGVPVSVTSGTRHVVTVNRVNGTTWHARVTLWHKRGPGDWLRLMRARDGRVGYNGLVRPGLRRQGSGTTPVGTYGLPSAFGQAPDPGTAMRYHRVRRGDYWVLDNASAYYNERRHISRGGFDPAKSEHLAAAYYRVPYRYAFVTSFNRPQRIRHRGGAIFLHVNGQGATAGCVSVPEWFVRRTLRRVAPATGDDGSVAFPRIAIGW